MSFTLDLFADVLPASAALCTPLANRTPADSLAAPAVAGGGECARLRRERRVARVVAAMALRDAFRWVVVTHGWQGPSAHYFRCGTFAREAAAHCFVGDVGLCRVR